MKYYFLHYYILYGIFVKLSLDKLNIKLDNFTTVATSLTRVSIDPLVGCKIPKNGRKIIFAYNK